MVEEIDKLLNDKKKLTALARAAFDEVDNDKSGFICEEELKQVMTTISAAMKVPKPSEKQVLTLYR
jgi:Ca2+-binding EF-hand superfamily protein